MNHRHKFPPPPPNLPDRPYEELYQNGAPQAARELRRILEADQLPDDVAALYYYSKLTGRGFENPTGEDGADGLGKEFWYEVLREEGMNRQEYEFSEWEKQQVPESLNQDEVRADLIRQAVKLDAEASESSDWQHEQYVELASEAWQRVFAHGGELTPDEKAALFHEEGELPVTASAVAWQPKNGVMQLAEMPICISPSETSITLTLTEAHSKHPL